MNKLFRMIVLSSFVIGLTACDFFGGDTTIGSESDLLGYWEDSLLPGSIIVFTSEPVSTQDSAFESFDGYKWGKEWDENDNVYEEDVNRDYHGNQWFIWKKEPTMIRKWPTQNYRPGVSSEDMNLNKLTSTTLDYTTSSRRHYTFKKRIR